MNIKQVYVNELVPYGKNAKTHDETQIKNVAESIKQFGFVQPIVIDKNKEVVIGHCRLMAAQRLKMESVPCVSVDELTDEQVKALRIVDNKTNESPWDVDLLAEELGGVDLEAFDLFFDICDPCEEEAEEKLKEEENEEQKLPQSRIFGFSVSAFGTSSECFINIPLSADDSEKLLDVISEKGTEELSRKVEESIKCLMQPNE